MIPTPTPIYNVYVHVHVDIEIRGLEGNVHVHVRVSKSMAPVSAFRYIPLKVDGMACAKARQPFWLKLGQYGYNFQVCWRCKSLQDIPQESCTALWR